MIRPVRPSDYDAICEIYNHYIAHTTVTFDIEQFNIADIQAKFEKNSAYPCLVFDDNGTIQGFAAALQWKAKKAYLHTVESSIYINPGYTNKGYGSQLYGALIQLMKAEGIHSIIAGIIMPNQES